MTVDLFVNGTLYRGTVFLSDRRAVQGILYPRHLAEGIHRDISAFGGWREYIGATVSS